MCSAICPAPVYVKALLPDRLRQTAPCKPASHKAGLNPASSNRPVQTSKPQGRPGQPAPATGILAAKTARPQRERGVRRENQQALAMAGPTRPDLVRPPVALSPLYGRCRFCRYTSHHARRSISIYKTCACTMLCPQENVSRGWKMKSRKHRRDQEVQSDLVQRQRKSESHNTIWPLQCACLSLLRERPWIGKVKTRKTFCRTKPPQPPLRIEVAS